LFNVTLATPTITLPNSGNPVLMENSIQKQVTITGTNFVSGEIVEIVGVANGMDVTVASSTQLITVIPPGIVPGTYDIKVTNPIQDAGRLHP